MTNSSLLKMVIYSGFTHWKLWFSTVMLVYQRVPHERSGYTSNHPCLDSFDWRPDDRWWKPWRFRSKKSWLALQPNASYQPQQLCIRDSSLCSRAFVARISSSNWCYFPLNTKKATRWDILWKFSQEYMWIGWRYKLTLFFGYYYMIRYVWYVFMFALLISRWNTWWAHCWVLHTSRSHVLWNSVSLMFISHEYSGVDTYQKKNRWAVFQNPLFSMLECGHALLLLIWMAKILVDAGRPDPPWSTSHIELS